MGKFMMTRKNSTYKHLSYHFSQVKCDNRIHGLLVQEVQLINKYLIII